MRNLMIVALVSLPACAAAQAPLPTQDYWIRAAISHRALSGANGLGGALLASGNMAFGGMTNEVRHVVLIGAETGDHQQETAVLVGLRRVETNRSLSLAGGIGISSHTTTPRGLFPASSSGDVKRRVGPYAGVALALHGTGFVKSWMGLGGGLIANINRRSSFWAMVFSMDVGDLRDPKNRPPPS